MSGPARATWRSRRSRAVVDLAERDGRAPMRRGGRCGRVSWRRSTKRGCGGRCLRSMRAGDRSGGDAAYDAFARRLAADLEVEPSAEARALFERLRTPRPASAIAPTERRLPPAPTRRGNTSPAPPQTERIAWWPVVGAAVVVAVLADRLVRASERHRPCTGAA